MSGQTKSSGTAPQISPVRLLATLGGAGALAGLLIVGAYTSSTPAIEANRMATIDAAIREVLQGLDHYQVLYPDGGTLTTAPHQAAGAHAASKIYAGFDAKNRLIGFALTAREPGFQEAVEILFGFDPRTKTTLGLAILSSRETPGLGDKIQGAEWRAQFRDTATPLRGVKKGAQKTAASVDMITGATISSRAVIGAMNKSLEHWTPLLDAYLREGRP